MKPTKEQLAQIEEAFSHLIEALKPFDHDGMVEYQIHELAADVFRVLKTEPRKWHSI